MQEAASYFVGTHDFTSFRATQCQSKSPIKTLDELAVVQKENKMLRIFDLFKCYYNGKNFKCLKCYIY